MKRLLLFVGLFLLPVSAGFAQTVLVEAFTNTACTNCITPDGQITNYVTTHPNLKLIFYHNNFPSPKDPFFKANKSGSNYRGYGFYNVQADPEAHVRGANGGSAFSSWKSLITDSQGPYSADIAIGLKSIDGGKIQIDVTTTGTSNNKSVQLMIAMTESGIAFNNTESFGNPPSGVWDNVFRKMLPGDSGSTPFVLSGTKTITAIFDTTGTGWHAANMEVIAFLQTVASLPLATTDSAAIIGVGVRPLSSLGVTNSKAVSGALLGSASPDPFTNTTMLPLHLNKTSQVRMVVVNSIGQEVATLADRVFEGGDANIRLDATNLANGIYMVRLFLNGVFHSQMKVVCQR
jgi:hypothetical protein